MGIYRRFFTFLTLSLAFSGCANEKMPKKQMPLEQKTELSYDLTQKLAERVADLCQKVFPDGLVLDIGRNSKGEKRYLSVKVLKEDEANKSLEVILYTGPGLLTEAKLDDFLLNRNYVAAAKELNEGGLEKTRFYDSGTNGISPTGRKDFISLMQRDGSTWFNYNNITDYEQVNNDYRIILNALESALKEKAKIE